MLKVRKIAFKTAHYTLRESIRETEEARSILMRSAEFWFVQYCFVAKLSVGYVNTRDDHNSKRQHVYEAKAICWSKLLELKMCYLLNFNIFYFFCLHCLINIHIFDYPDSWLSGLFTLVPPSPDNQGSTVPLNALGIKNTGIHICCKCSWCPLVQWLFCKPLLKH